MDRVVVDEVTDSRSGDICSVDDCSECTTIAPPTFASPIIAPRQLLSQHFVRWACCSTDNCSADICFADNCSADICSVTIALPTFAPLTIVLPTFAPPTFASPTIAPTTIAPPTIAPTSIASPDYSFANNCSGDNRSGLR